MASATNYLRDALADHVMGGDPFTQPTTLYLALFTTQVQPDGTGTEVTGGSYGREEIEFDDGAGVGQKVNQFLAFTDMPAVTVEGIAIMDASSGGNMLYYANLDEGLEVLAGTVYPVNEGSLSITHVGAA